MAIVVGIHGIGQQYKGAHTLRAEWLAGLKDGLARAEHALESDEDFACAFYGELFRSPGKKSAALAPPLDAADVAEGTEQDLLELWWREAARIDPTVRSAKESTKIGTPRLVQRALDALSHSRVFAGVTTRLMIADLKQVRRYLQEPETRRMARSSLERVVGLDTRVIIAHSLGSVVAYETLCAHPEWSVRVLVTLGSPLGISNVIFDELEPTPEGDVGAWPGEVKRWINVADESDVVALVKRLNTCFGARVEDHLVDNGAKAHDVTRYLTTREVGDAVAAGL